MQHKPSLSLLSTHQCPPYGGQQLAETCCGQAPARPTVMAVRRDGVVGGHAVARYRMYRHCSDWATSTACVRVRARVCVASDNSSKKHDPESLPLSTEVRS